MDDFCHDHSTEQCCLDRRTMEESPKKSDHMGILIIIADISIFLFILFLALIMTKKKRQVKVNEPQVVQTRRMRVIHAYAPVYPDELELKPGAMIQLIKTFDDGWGLGMTENGHQGAFPMVCTVEVSQKEVVSRSDMKISHRVSSILPK
jgi:hypothetical protein